MGTRRAEAGSAATPSTIDGVAAQDDLLAQHLAAAVVEGGDVEGVRAVGGVLGGHGAGQRAVAAEGDPVGARGLQPRAGPVVEGRPGGAAHRLEELRELAVAEGVARAGGR